MIVGRSVKRPPAPIDRVFPWIAPLEETCPPPFTLVSNEYPLTTDATSRKIGRSRYRNLTMFSSVWSFQDSAMPRLYSKRSRGTTRGPIERQPAQAKAARVRNEMKTLCIKSALSLSGNWHRSHAQAVADYQSGVLRVDLATFLPTFYSSV